MGIWKKYKMWRNFNELLDYWTEREYKLDDMSVKYKPRTKPQWYGYGRAIGELETIQRAVNILKYDLDEDEIEPVE